MNHDRPYFFCGIGGSGMLPLALIMRAKGVTVAGSDRALDQGRTAPKFEFLKTQGIALFPQDGSGVMRAEQIVVASAAVEDTVPDVVAARRVGATMLGRAELLSDLFNEARVSIGVAGTSGKSTTTGMIGWILKATGRDPTVMNGAVMTNFVSPDVPFASSLVGKSGIFVSEVDESDGSIARYTPTVAVVNNISLDHKSMDELRALFIDYVAKAKVAVLNLDNAETTALLGGAKQAITYSLSNSAANLVARNIEPAPHGVSFEVESRGDAEAAEKGISSPSPRFRVNLKVPGRHNVSNALAALAAAQAVAVSLQDAARALEDFRGVRRRLEVVGMANGITVIDDFAHNPDKIAATLATLHDFPGRLLIMFQPHGFSPLQKMKTEFIDGFAQGLSKDDILLMPEPVYFGGTTTREVTSADIAAGIRAANRNAFALSDRAACGDKLIELAKPSDRIVIMGARDDTLTTFAQDLLKAVS
jgi:UDP-N-acetylmuramate--alanine ligase